MTAPASLTRPRPPTASPSTTYLLLYNLVSAILWLTILGRLLLLLTLAPSPAHIHTYAALGPFTRNVQSLALLEILHSATGAVRSPLSTTVMQVASRVVLVWVVVEGFRGYGAEEEGGWSNPRRIRLVGLGTV
ncbi:MAG: hypothetical protein OHK93_008714 [Ramalina farinacea]|uniref:Very-long-chain (3R)-3-hydroxyacyl-CoA dehydratase n=1 Tax=Ramalina farinacea TaxID=258253 RepID=A0AA43TS45_9LECA|nr:hypothetical protein [Ramalina farinacea]